MRALPRSPLHRLRGRTALLLAAGCLAAVSVVQASIRASANKPVHVHRRFDIYGRLAGPLTPGASQPVPIRLNNRLRSTLWITSLRVGVVVDRKHAAAGCSTARDFVVTQLPLAAYPIKLPPGTFYRPGWPAQLRWPVQSWSLRALGVATLPTVSMLDLPLVNQDGCKGARLRLVFRARAYRSATHARSRP
jgi:hypothetical protein